MRMGRFASPWVALGALFFFCNIQAALADDAGWVASHLEGSCGSVDEGGHGGGGGGCGFLGLGCVGDAIAHAWDDTGGKVVHAVASAPWGQIGRDAAAFAVNFAIAAVTAAVAVAVITAAVVAFPVAAPFIIGAAIAVGVAGLAYTGWKVWQNRDHMSQADWFGLAGSLIGGLVGGLGPAGEASRSVGAFVGGFSPWASTGVETAVAAADGAASSADSPRTVGIKTSTRNYAGNPDYAYLEGRIRGLNACRGVTNCSDTAVATDLRFAKPGQVPRGLAGAQAIAADDRPPVDGKLYLEKTLRRVYDCPKCGYLGNENWVGNSPSVFEGSLRQNGIERAILWVDYIGADGKPYGHILNVVSAGGEYWVIDGQDGYVGLLNDTTFLGTHVRYSLFATALF